MVADFSRSLETAKDQKQAATPCIDPAIIFSCIFVVACLLRSEEGP